MIKQLNDIDFWDLSYADMVKSANTYIEHTFREQSTLVSRSAPLLYVKTTDNNAHAHLTWKSADGKYCSLTSSTGRLGYKGAKRGTAEAAQTLVRWISQRALSKGVTHVHLLINGIGPGRGVVGSSIDREGISVLTISDSTAVPHGGCRGKKLRRV